MKIAIGSSGAFSFEYLENADSSDIHEINNVLKKMSEDIKSGK